jgi:hypothetical protein
VRTGLVRLAGVERVEYDAGRRLFRVRHDASRVNAGDILASVRETGRKMGRDYLPEVVGSCFA